jgi:hypothetical protein
MGDDLARKAEGGKRKAESGLQGGPRVLISGSSKMSPHPHSPTNPEQCPHCQAPVVGWKRRWFRDNTYHCEACGGDSRPMFRKWAPFKFAWFMVWFIGTVELKRRGYVGNVWNLAWGIPMVVFFAAMELRQPLRKVIQDKPSPYPKFDPNPC